MWNREHRIEQRRKQRREEKRQTIQDREQKRKKIHNQQSLENREEKREQKLVNIEYGKEKYLRELKQRKRYLQQQVKFQLQVFVMIMDYLLK